MTGVLYMPLTKAHIVGTVAEQIGYTIIKTINIAFYPIQ
jgi:hypothetical protein